MDGATILNLLLTFILLVLFPKAESQWPRLPPIPPSPLCASQFALVNHACYMLPYTPVPPPAPPSPDTPPAPPSPDDPDSTHGHEHGHGHGHGHGHRRHRHGGHSESPAEADCCKWLKEVDSVCVCDLLVHLPPFLTRPVHNYTVVVDDTCDVTFQCASRWVK